MGWGKRVNGKEIYFYLWFEASFVTVEVLLVTCEMSQYEMKLELLESISEFLPVQINQAYLNYDNSNFSIEKSKSCDGYIRSSVAEARVTKILWLFLHNLKPNQHSNLFRSRAIFDHQVPYRIFRHFYSNNLYFRFCTFPKKDLKFSKNHLNDVFTLSPQILWPWWIIKQYELILSNKLIIYTEELQYPTTCCKLFKELG